MSLAQDVGLVAEGHVDAVVGVSMGGLIALYLAARHPDAVGRVALVASSASVSARSLEAAGRGSDFIFGCEESHGYLTGSYARDKDAAGAAIWISEYAAELKRRGKTLVDALDDVYAAYGYCHNYLTEIRLLVIRDR